MSSILSRSFNGRMTVDRFIVGTTDCNIFFPAYLVQTEDYLRYNESYIYCKHIIDGIYLYYKPRVVKHLMFISKYDELIERFKSNYMCNTFTFTIDGVNREIYVSRGIIMDEFGNILIMLCTNTLHPYKKDARNRNIYDPEKFLLLVSNEFKTSPIYKNVFKKVLSDYIEVVSEEGVDVIYTSSEKILKRVYNNNFSIQHSTISDLSEILQNQVSDLIFYRPETNSDTYLSTEPNLYREEEEVSTRDLLSLQPQILDGWISSFNMAENARILTPASRETFNSLTLEAVEIEREESQITTVEYEEEETPF